MNMPKLVHLFCFFPFSLLLWQQSAGQTCSGGGAPTSVTLSLSGKNSVDLFDDNNNDRGTLTVGFPGDVVAIQVTGINLNTVGLSYCEEAVIEIADVRNSASNYVDIYPSIDDSNSPCFDLPFTDYFDLVDLGVEFPTNGTSIYWELWETLDDNTNTTDATYSAGTVTIYVCPTGQQLPLELKSFTGRLERSSNLIEWVTLSEQNTQAHIVERSPNGTTDWSEVGRVSAGGNTLSEHHYQLRDRYPLSESYYRLRTLEVDGQENLSKLVRLERSMEGFAINAVFPSPFIDQASLQFNTTEEQSVLVRVTDLAGRRMLDKSVDAAKGLNTISLDFSTLPAGSYFIQLDNGSIRSESVQVVRGDR